MVLLMVRCRSGIYKSYPTQEIRILLYYGNGETVFGFDIEQLLSPETTLGIGAG